MLVLVHRLFPEDADEITAPREPEVSAVAAAAAAAPAVAAFEASKADPTQSLEMTVKLENVTEAEKVIVDVVAAFESNLKPEDPVRGQRAKSAP